MLPSNREVAAPSCNALTTGIFRHDISLSFFSLSLFLFYLIPDPFTTTPLDPNKALRLLARTKMSAWKNRLLVLHETFHASGDYTSPVVFCRPFRYPGLPSSSDSADSALDDAPVALYFFFFWIAPFPLLAVFAWNRPFLSFLLFFFFYLFLLCILFFTGSQIFKKPLCQSGRESCHSCIIDSHDQYHTDLIESPQRAFCDVQFRHALRFVC